MKSALSVPHRRSPHRQSSLIIAIANQKGGVGKTTTTINLAAAIVGMGRPVLVIDLDPQGNTSTGLGVQETHRGSYALIARNAVSSQVIQSTAVPGLSLIPAEPNLAGAEVELVTSTDREYHLRMALSGLCHPASAHGLTVIDCPPSLGLLTLNALAAADAVLIPLQCEFFALEGITHFVRTVERVRSRFNSALRVNGIVLTMYDRRNNLSELVAADARGFFGERVYNTVIPRNVRVSEAPSHGQPVVVYDPRSPGAQAYIRLAREVLVREQMT